MKNCSITILILFSAMALQAHNVARVVRVKDADTYVLQSKQNSFTARLANVDAPEMNQSYGVTATQNVNKLLIGKLVEFDSIGKDIYGRVLVNIWVSGARLDSLEIRNGWAWLYVNYCNDAMLAKCQAIAVNEKLGLWVCGANAVCPPWLFRQYNYRNKLKYCKGCSK